MFGIDDIAGSFISGGLDILGGELSAAQARQQQRASADLQREFAKTGIQWRVEDAKKAGLHPLYALGAPPMSASTSLIGDELGTSISRAGQNIGSALNRSLDPMTKQMSDAQYRLLSAQADKTGEEAAALRAQNALNLQGQGGIGAPMSDPSLHGQAPNVPAPNQLEDIVEFGPNKLVSPSSRGAQFESGTKSKYAFQQITPRFKEIVPAAENQEATNEMLSEESYSQWVARMLYNNRYFGPSWLEDKLRVTGGFESKRDYRLGGSAGAGVTNTLVNPPESWKGGTWDSVKREIMKGIRGVRRYAGKTWRDYNRR